MFKIAICDDEEKVCAEMEEIILQYGQNSRLLLDVEVYYAGEDLLKQLGRGEYFDLVFLDIEMKPMNGVEVGKEIRETYKNECTKIIYISGVEGYAMELFDIRPLNFLIKPVKKEKIIFNIDKARHLIEQYEEVFEFSCNKTIERLHVKDIIYFTSQARRVKIITIEGYKVFYGKLSEVEKRLSSNFIRIHKSYLVNKNYISEYTYENIRLFDGQMLNITRQYRNDVRTSLMRKGL